MNATKIKLFPDQSKAFELVKRKRVVNITGAAGTGKTRLVKGIVDYFKDKGLTVTLAAPSGKASKRLYESTGQTAYTIHKLLEPQRNKKG